MKNTLMRSVLCLLLVVSVVAVSDAANQSRVGTAGAQELLIPVGARGIAIGGSSMIFANGVDAIYWNPAGLGRDGFPQTVQGTVDPSTPTIQYVGVNHRSVDLHVSGGS